jgi:hypothetical protein
MSQVQLHGRGDQGVVAGLPAGLGPEGRMLVNSAHGFGELGLARLESAVAAIPERFSGPVADGNAVAAEAAYRFVDKERRAAGHRVGAQEG